MQVNYREGLQKLIRFCIKQEEGMANFKSRYIVGRELRDASNEVYTPASKGEQEEGRR